MIFVAAAVATSNKTADSTNGFDSDDDCESVKSFASSVDSFMPDDNTEGNKLLHYTLNQDVLKSKENDNSIKYWELSILLILIEIDMS